MAGTLIWRTDLYTNFIRFAQRMATSLSIFVDSVRRPALKAIADMDLPGDTQQPQASKRIDQQSVRNCVDLLRVRDESHDATQRLLLAASLQATPWGKDRAVPVMYIYIYNNDHF